MPLLVWNFIRGEPEDEQERWGDVCRIFTCVNRVNEGVCYFRRSNLCALFTLHTVRAIISFFTTTAYSRITQRTNTIRRTTNVSMFMYKIFTEGSTRVSAAASITEFILYSFVYRKDDRWMCVCVCTHAHTHTRATTFNLQSSNRREIMFLVSHC